MIRVQAPSRLHFGLLSLPGPPRWPNLDGEDGVPARRFGGVGLMIEAPCVRVSVGPAPAWTAEGPLADRALAFARQFSTTFPPEVIGPQHIHVEQCPPDHVGLGTGTQLGLAVARALQAAGGLPEMTAAELAGRVGRGERSALGIHGFAHGGFLVEAGKGPEEAVAPLVARVEFPPEWRIVLAVPGGVTGLHGGGERHAFAELAALPARTDALCRLVLLGLLPALAARAFPAFSDALYDFNARAGEWFAPVQGGRYAGPAVAELVALVRGQGVRGVGQSSWGPTVFAVAADPEQATRLAGRIRDRFSGRPTRVQVTQGAAAGHEISSCEDMR